MGNRSSGGCGCAKEEEDFEPFAETNGAVRALVVTLDYKYSKGNELTGNKDGDHMVRICKTAQVEDITIMRDDFPMDDPRFPTAKNVLAMMREVGARCEPGDFFVFFFAGHGENVPDKPPMDEDDGFDEAFVTPGPKGEIDMKYFFVDDDFAKALEKHIPVETKILCILDCCHSCSMCDIDSHDYKGHKICSLAACQDDEESADTGHGGILTISIERAMTQLSVSRGSSEYSIQSLWEIVVGIARGICKDQKLEMQHCNLDPELTAWPMPHPWWKHFSRG